MKRPEKVLYTAKAHSTGGRAGRPPKIQAQPFRHYMMRNLERESFKGQACFCKGFETDLVRFGSFAPGSSSRKSGHVCYAPQAEVISEHLRIRQQLQPNFRALSSLGHFGVIAHQPPSSLILASIVCAGLP